MRLIDADALIVRCKEILECDWNKRAAPISWSDAYESFTEEVERQPTIECYTEEDVRNAYADGYSIGMDQSMEKAVVHGRWVLEAHNERVNYRWNVTTKCFEYCSEPKEIWAGSFPGFPDQLARDTALQCAEQVKLSNYCPNCGAKMEAD